MFTVVVDQVFEIAGRGVVIRGTVTAGVQPRAGEVVTIHSEGQWSVTAVVHGIDPGVPPPKVGLLLGGVSRKQIPRGARLTAP
jgi:translation elongation factor EF-Tu-like GTPase